MLFTGDAEQRFDCRTCAEKRENQSQPGFRIKQTIQILPKQDSIKIVPTIVTPIWEKNAKACRFPTSAFPLPIVLCSQDKVLLTRRYCVVNASRLSARTPSLLILPYNHRGGQVLLVNEALVVL